MTYNLSRNFAGRISVERAALSSLNTLDAPTMCGYN
jgi:hypothetical protein